jgi:hypothetical protein
MHSKSPNTRKSTKEAKKCLKLLILAAIASTSLNACGTITNAHVRHMSNEELIVHRMQMMRRLAGPHYSSGRLGDDGDISSQQRDLEATERELMRRGLINARLTTQQIGPTNKIIYGNPQPLYQ